VGRYYFNLYDGDVTLDEEGSEFPDLAGAKAQASASALEMACAEVLAGHLTLGHRIEVIDESGVLAWTVHFGDVISVDSERSPQGRERGVEAPG
jgi:hypothetical protein